MLTSIKGWESKVNEFTEKVANHVGNLAYACFVDVFERYDKSPICQKARSVVEDFLSAAIVQHRTSMERLWRLESSEIRTLNHRDYENLRRENELRLSERRRRNLEDQRDEKKLAKELAKEAVGQPIVTPVKGRGRPKQRAPSPTPEVDEVYDHYRREVKVLAEAQAYYDIARKRYIDYVYMTIMGELLEACKNGLLERLKIQMGIEGLDGKFTPHAIKYRSRY